MYKKISYSELIKKLESHNRWFKGFNGGVVVKLQIPKGAVVFSINNGKCRTNIAKVVRIDSGLKDVCSDKDTSFHYKLGKTVKVKDFDLDYSRECSTGIHFFRTMRELQEYRFYLP